MNKKGFTLVELLVVIAIIGLLATLAFVSLNSARAKARDAKRVSDVRQTQSALELFYNNQVIPGYPDLAAGETNNVCGTNEACWAGLAGTGTTLPTPPAQNDCGATGNNATDAEVVTQYGGANAAARGENYFYKAFDSAATSGATLVGHVEGAGICIDEDGCAGYEITYCLGGATGGIQSGINTAYEAGIDGGV